MPADTRTQAVRTWPARLHTTLGVLLAGYACFHAFQNYPALKAPEAWVDRSLATSLGWAAALAVMASIVLHAALGLRSYLLQRTALRRAGATRDGGIGFQLFTGALVLGFVAYHVIQLWTGSPGAHTSLREPYARLWERLGEPVSLVIYVTGVSALAFHVGHGLLRMIARARFNGARPLGRALGGVLGFVLLFVFVQIVARFALGEALIPALS